MKYSAGAECEIIYFVNCEMLHPAVATWNEINPLTPARHSHGEVVFHARSAFHKSRKGFISLKRNTICLVDKWCFFSGGERGIWTLAPVTRPTPLAGEPLHHLGISPLVNIINRKTVIMQDGGESGIRTHGALRHDGFQDRSVMTTSVSLRKSAYKSYHILNNLSITFLKNYYFSWRKSYYIV